MNSFIIKLKKLLQEWQVKLVDEDRYILSSADASIIREKLKPVLAEAFGYHALLYSALAKTIVNDNLSIGNAVIISDQKISYTTHGMGIKPDISCRYSELPISSDSIDLIVIPKVLQHDHFPHQVLREVERVLIPEGQIILLVENTFGWSSIKNRIQAFIAEPHFKTRVISRTRLSDWFRLLGLEISQEIAVYHTTNLNNARVFRWMNKTEAIKKIFFSNYYIIVAKKKVSTLTPIRSSWRSNRKLVRPRLAEPSVRVPVEKILNQTCCKE